ncbi:MAG: UPF0280 family protein, partial [Planctomycetota bacterium]|nr:UPF0280 family protein [Planctomycetota bacterium]
DACCVVCKDAADADAAATAFANRVKRAEDVRRIATEALLHPKVKGVVGVADKFLSAGGCVRLTYC